MTVAQLETFIRWPLYALAAFTVVYLSAVLPAVATLHAGGRVMTDAPKIKTEVEHFTYMPGDGLVFCDRQDATITITTTITDGRVTACETIIHD